MADTPHDPLASPLGAGTSTPPDAELDAAEVAKLKATQPGGSDFDVDNASDADYKRHKEILKRRKEVADLAIVPAPAAPATPVPVTVVEAPAPPTFSAPSAPLSQYHNSQTGQQIGLTQKMYEGLSDEDKVHITPVAEKAAPLPTV